MRRQLSEGHWLCGFEDCGLWSTSCEETLTEYRRFTAAVECRSQCQAGAKPFVSYVPPSSGEQAHVLSRILMMWASESISGVSTLHRRLSLPVAARETQVMAAVTSSTLCVFTGQS